MNIVNSSDSEAGLATMHSIASDAGAWAASMASTAVFGHTCDAWIGSSRDLIERFVEVTCLQKSLSRSARRGYRSDLVALDNWMQRTRERTLVGARSSELRTYVDERTDVGIELRLLRRLLTSLNHFYRHLHETGCRDDNPAKRLQQQGAPSRRAMPKSHSAHR